MKKVKTIGVQTLSALALTALLLGGCAKEGKPDHRQHLSEVYATELIEHDGEQYHYLDTYLAERWHWNDDELIRIDYSDDATYCEWFYYDTRGRIVRTEVPAYGIKNCFDYQGRKLARIDCYRHDELEKTLRFTHDGTKLATLEIIPATGGAKAALPPEVSPLRMLIGSEMAAVVEAQAKMASAATKAPTATLYKFKWSDGNLVKMTCTEADGTTWEATMKYDDKRNPYSELWGYYEMNDPIFGFQMMSTNNLTQLVMPYQGNDNQLVEYIYTYDGKYPDHRTTTYSYVALSEQTWDEIVVTYTKEETIHYK